MNTTFRILFFGFMGNSAVEILKILSYYNAGGVFPKRYGKWGFWLSRVLLALIGGGLAVAYGVGSDIVAVHIGASTPAIIGMFAKNPPDEHGEAEPSKATPPASPSRRPSSSPSPTEA